MYFVVHLPNQTTVTSNTFAPADQPQVKSLLKKAAAGELTYLAVDKRDGETAIIGKELLVQSTYTISKPDNA